MSRFKRCASPSCKSQHALLGVLLQAAGAIDASNVNATGQLSGAITGQAIQAAGRVTIFNVVFNRYYYLVSWCWLLASLSSCLNLACEFDRYGGRTDLTGTATITQVTSPWSIQALYPCVRDGLSVNLHDASRFAACCAGRLDTTGAPLCYPASHLTASLFACAQGVCVLLAKLPLRDHVSDDVAQWQHHSGRARLQLGPERPNARLERRRKILVRLRRSAEFCCSPLFLFLICVLNRWSFPARIAPGQGQCVLSAILCSLARSSRS